MSPPPEPNTPQRGVAPTDLTHLNDRGQAAMVDVGDKPLTQRTALAEARLRINAALAQAIRADTLAKGNALEVARLAGIQAAKHTPLMIPLCHPMPLDAVDLTAELSEQTVVIRAEVRTTWKTGVEMEAMTAASAAALTVIDMGKAIDRGIVIESVKLLRKTGGRHGDYVAPNVTPTPTANPPKPDTATDALSPPIRVAVLTVSDRCAAGLTTDTSGPALVQLCRDELHATLSASETCPDEPEQIAAQLTRWADEQHPPDLILTTGGTGLAPRDHTPEATATVLHRRHPALLELARQRCYASTPRAALSRGESGTRHRSLILNLPGSRRGATEMLKALLDILPHAIETLRGDVTDDGRARDTASPPEASSTE